ncbi:hypothetical protein [Photobacterium sanguinicancri]|uniref:hypothetical protein n=1 Tax=Photobacterium sanguinicancri TaxID=875932 RepID=UPI0030B97445
MDVATSFSAFHSSEQAISDAIRKLNMKIANPKLVLAYLSEHYDELTIQARLAEAYPDSQILACTSCKV